MEITKNPLVYLIVGVIIVIAIFFVYTQLNGPKELTEAGEEIKDCGEGTVLYLGENLCWQRGVNPNKANWQSAKEYCDNLDLGGKDDWRLPTADELKSIIDDTYEPAINTQYFKETDAAHYWTSSEYKPSMHFYIHFELGYQGFAFDYSEYGVRCVRDNSLF